MSTGPHYFKVGLFVITAMTIGVIGVIFLGAGSLFEKKFLVETYFEESVQGLDVGSPLKFRGLPIGRVEELTMVAKEYVTDRRYIMALASISSDALRLRKGHIDPSIIENEVKQGLRIRLGFQGLTGTAYLELDYMDPIQYPALQIDWKPHHLYIPSAPGTIARVSDALDRIMRTFEHVNAQEFTENLQKSMNAITQVLEKGNLERLSEQTLNLIKEMRETNLRIGAILEGPEVTSILSDTSSTMAAARRMVEESQKPLQQLLTAVTHASSDIDNLTKSLHSISGDAPEALARLKRVLQRLDHLIRAQEPDIQAAVENIRIATENLRALTDDARRYPSLFLFGEPPARSGPEEESP
jgi:phospholipid/cholesterol/gamma-HCH transport system substrate-binding protein/paraquat-inducible protein B